MKTFFSILLILVMMFLLSFRSQSPSFFIKEINSSFAKIKDNLYFAKYETSNKEYRSYLLFLKETNQIERYKQNLLDTSKWGEEKRNLKPFVFYYHSNAAYDNYPVVTVSYENAIDYCKWLTQQYNNNPSKKFKKVIFRLPTESEWIYAATVGKNERMYSWDGNEVKNKKGTYLANIKTVNEANISFDSKNENYNVHSTFIEEQTRWILAEKKSFQPNEFGLYNMIGNAAEMIDTKSIAKGGSFNDAGFDVRVQNQKRYANPSPEIGFRVVMEIVEF